MTPEKFLNGGNFKVVSADQFVGNGGFRVVTDEAPGYVDRLKADFAARNKKVQDAKTRTAQGKQSTARGVFQTIGQAAGLAGDVVTEAIAPTVNAVADKISDIPALQRSASEKGGIANNILAGQDDLVSRFHAWAEKHPGAAADAEAAFNIGTLLPAGKAASVGAKTAATGAGTAVRGTGTAVARVGSATKAAGEKLYDTGFNKTVAEAERQLRYEADTPFLTRVSNAVAGKPDPKAPRLASGTAFERGIMGTEKMIGVQAKRAADTLWREKIAPAVKQSPAALTRDELFAPAERLVAETTDPTRRNALKNALDSLKEDYADTDVWSLDVAQALKRDLDTFTPTKMFRGQDVASEMRTLQHAMADGIRRFTYDSLADVNIKKDYLDWANLHSLEQVGVKAISEAKLKGGFGSFWSGMWDMTTTPIKTIGGQVLYRVGNVFEFVGEKGIKRFGDFLARQGFQRPNSSASQPRSTPTK